MGDPIYLFLIVGVTIVALALFLSWMFRNRQRSHYQDDLNRNRADGDAIATWSGIDHSGDDD